MALPAIVTQKFGPLPGWAWGGLGLGAAVIWSVWQRNRSEVDADAGSVTESYELPETSQPTYVFQNYDQEHTTINTPPWLPPGGGRPPPTPTPTPTPTPKPKTPAKSAPKGTWVTIVPWKKGQRKGTPSTVWGVAEKIYGKGTAWKTVWSAPQNARLRTKRGSPEQVRPGDRIWAPS